MREATTVAPLLVLSVLLLEAAVDRGVDGAAAVAVVDADDAAAAADGGGRPGKSSVLQREIQIRKKVDR